MPSIVVTKQALNMKLPKSIYILFIIFFGTSLNCFSSYNKQCEKDLRKRYKDVVYLAHSDCYLIRSKDDRSLQGVADNVGKEVVAPYYKKCTFELTVDNEVLVFAMEPSPKSGRQGNLVVSLKRGEVLNMGNTEPILVAGSFITSYGKPIYNLNGVMLLDCQQISCQALRRGQDIIAFKVGTSTKINGAVKEHLIFCDETFTPIFSIADPSYMWRIEESRDDKNNLIWVCTKGENGSQQQIISYSATGEPLGDQPKFANQNVQPSNKSVKANQRMADESFKEATHVIESPAKSYNTNTVADVDSNIPKAKTVAESTFALIISNENYAEVEDVPFANNDGKSMARYCKDVLGIPEKNIKHIENATLGQMKRQLHWLSQVADVYGGEAKIIFYYSGHGMPDETSKDAYLLPVDGYYSDMSTNLKVNDLYESLGNLNVKQVLVFMDACFSGSQRGDEMLVSARGVKLKAKTGRPSGKTIVLSAAQGNETAYPYNEKKHGMFTYFLLKKLQNDGAEVSLGDLCDYIIDQVKKTSLGEIDKIQTPCVSASMAIEGDWRNKSL